MVFKASKTLGYSLSSFSNIPAFCIRKQLVCTFVYCSSATKNKKDTPKNISSVQFLFSFYPTGQAHPKCSNWLEVNAVSQDPLGLLRALQRVSVRGRADVCSLSNMQKLFQFIYKNWSKSRTCKSLGKSFCLPIFKTLNFNNKKPGWLF